jgi:hypothetical protein
MTREEFDQTDPALDERPSPCDGALNKSLAIVRVAAECDGKDGEEQAERALRSVSQGVQRQRSSPQSVNRALALTAAEHLVMTDTMDSAQETKELE